MVKQLKQEGAEEGVPIPLLSVDGGDTGGIREERTNRGGLLEASAPSRPETEPGIITHQPNGRDQVFAICLFVNVTISDEKKF